MTDYASGRDLDALAARLYSAVAEARPIAQLTDELADLTPEEGYRIQATGIALRQSRSETVVGIKMGLTSRAKMAQVGVDRMCWGQLTDAMRVEEGGGIARHPFIHPRAEPEVAFLLRRPLHGAVSPAEALAAVEAVAPAIEIIDSRYRDFRFSLADVVADNSSSAAFVLGGWSNGIGDVGNLGIVLEVDGRPMEIGSSAAILGHPLRALAAAARMTAESEFLLEPGMIVLAGAATAAVPLRPGMRVRALLERLGDVSFKVGD